jgi:hypothetical protein
MILFGFVKPIGIYYNIRMEFRALFAKAFLTIIIAAIILISPSTALAESPGVYTGVYSDNVSTFETDSGKNVSIEMIYQNWNEGDFPTGQMNSIRSHGSIPLISWQSYDETNGGTTWGSIGSGSKDDYIRQWARESKEWGHPFFLRLDWEMNGKWEPNSAHSGDYVYMWKHVHDLFVAEGATNVTWVWCPNIDGAGTLPFDPMYPGGDYVDWVCMDGYNFGNTQEWGQWESFSQIYAPTYNHLLKLAPGKPIMIGEFATSEAGGSKPTWITQMLTTDLPKSFPNIKAIVWFNLNKETDWRIESSADSQKAYSQGIASSYYASNSFADLSTSPIPYLGSLSSQPAGFIAPAPKPTVVATLKPSPTITATATASATPSATPQTLVPTIVLAAKEETPWKKLLKYWPIGVILGLGGLTYLTRKYIL